MDKFIIHIEESMVVSKVIKAENIEDATAKARMIAESGESSLKVKKGWNEEYPVEGEVILVMKD
ncbi:unnamed protein product [marine sediment metagenome]|uniref:Uncharacterized protein n=1 Tax=marine sediment metagenome TaxID=412755 RepID=X0TE82_9ZZZZ